jgi:hypothetical protein
MYFAIKYRENANCDSVSTQKNFVEQHAKGPSQALVAKITKGTRCKTDYRRQLKSTMMDPRESYG